MTSAAKRAAISFSTGSAGQDSTLPPMWPHFWQRPAGLRCRRPAAIMFFISSKAFRTPPKPASRVGNDGREVVDAFVRVDATGPLDFVSTLEGVVDAANHGRDGLVRRTGTGPDTWFRRTVVAGNDLPAGRDPDSLQASLGLLHGLTSGVIAPKGIRSPSWRRR